MKKLALIIGLMVAVNVLFSQERREEMRDRMEMKIEEYKDRLNLTNDQVTDLKKVRESMKPELEALRADESKSRSDKMRAHADLIDKREAEVAKILNKEQLAELEVIKKEMKEKHMERRGKRMERRGDGR